MINFTVSTKKRFCIKYAYKNEKIFIKFFFYFADKLLKSFDNKLSGKLSSFCYNKSCHILYNKKQEVGKMEPLNLLLVEDEESLASFIQSELQFEGYQTSWETNGESALETFLQQKDQFDLILLDWMLPGLDGITVARRIRKVSKVPSS